MLLRFWFLPKSVTGNIGATVGNIKLLAKLIPVPVATGPGLKDFRPTKWLN